jgi:hypothetical protein
MQTEMNEPKKTYHDLLLELMKLRETDHVQFMEKLYEALSGEYKDVINDGTPVTEKRDAIWIMIKHFETREEFEKCAKLKKLSESLKDK